SLFAAHLGYAEMPHAECEKALHFARFQRMRAGLPIQEPVTTVLHNVESPGDALRFSEEPVDAEYEGHGLTKAVVKVEYWPDRYNSGAVANGYVQAAKIDAPGGPAIRIESIFLDNMAKDESGMERRIPKYILDPASAQHPEKIRTSTFATLLVLRH